MSTTLVPPPAVSTDGPDLPYDGFLLKAIPITTPALVLVDAIALFLGARLGLVDVAMALLSTLVGALILRRGRPVEPRMATLWLTLNAVAVGLVGLRPEASGVAAVFGVGLIVVAAVVIRRGWYTAFVAVVVGLQGAAIVHGASNDVTVVLMTATVGVGVGQVVVFVERKLAGSRRAIRSLSDERSTVTRLYEVASSIGASTTRSEALPDLLGVVASAVRARSAAVALLDDAAGVLTLVGPIWVNGSHIRVDDTVTAVVERAGFTGRALRATRAIRFERQSAGELVAILADLGLESGLLAPLRLEGKETGLILVGDPEDGSFDDADIAELTALASPASLVLAQVGIHEAALEMAERLREIADMKSDFVSMVSHELKTPLTSVLGALDTLSRPDLTLENPAVQEMLVAARRQAVKLRRLIDDLLVTSRIDRGLVRPETRPVQLSGVIADAVAVVPECRLTVDVPTGLSVLGDSDHLGQVVINLLENAIKYGAGTPIAVRAGLVSDRVVLTVSDHGPGVPPEQRDRVFERFVRLEGGDRARVGGTGLGLSIVKMLTEGMGGQVGVVETPGGGATFVVTLAPAV